MARARFATWQDGQTYVVFEFQHSKWGERSEGLLVTSNGGVWSAGYGLRPAFPKTASFWGRGGSMDPHYRLPLVWARKAMRGKPAGYIAKTEAAKVDETVIEKYGPDATDVVSFVGFTRAYAKRSAHSLQVLTEILAESARVTKQKWSWKPANLQCWFHDKSKAFGLAYNPGGKVHRISLNMRMLEAYDRDAVYRVILHELCHHYRDESFPRNPFNDHDETFCRELMKVDLTLKSKEKKACALFIDKPDVALVATLGERIGRKTIEPIWDAHAGTLLLDRNKSDGAYRLVWMPNPGNKWTKKREPVSDPTMLALAKRFAPKDYVRVQVTVNNWPWPNKPSPTNLLELFQYFSGKNSKYLDKTQAYLQSVIDFVKGAPL